MLHLLGGAECRAQMSDVIADGCSICELCASFSFCALDNDFCVCIVEKQPIDFGLL